MPPRLWGMHSLLFQRMVNLSVKHEIAFYLKVNCHSRQDLGGTDGVSKSGYVAAAAAADEYHSIELTL